ncbi:MAG: hypothetical protein ABFE01_17290, partial [Phycisphaerales bacterium]
MGKTFAVGLVALLILSSAGESRSANIAPFLTSPSQQISDPSGMHPLEAGPSLTTPETPNRKLGPRIKSLIDRHAALRERGARVPQSDAQDRIRVMLQTREGSQVDAAGILSRNG